MNTLQRTARTLVRVAAARQVGREALGARSTIVPSQPFRWPAPRPASFSTAVAVDDEPKKPKKSKKKRRSLDDHIKDPIIVTDRAAERIKELLAGDNASGAIGIRLGVRRRGCNGLSYTLNYATEKPDKDIAMEAHGFHVFIEPMALFNIVGTVMDWEETELSSEFTFNNPNSKGSCGCGESFNV